MTKINRYFHIHDKGETKEVHIGGGCMHSGVVDGREEPLARSRRYGRQMVRQC